MDVPAPCRHEGFSVYSNFWRYSMLRRLVLVLIPAACVMAAACPGGSDSSAGTSTTVAPRTPCVIVYRGRGGAALKTTTDTAAAGRPCTTAVYVEADSVLPDTVRVDSVLIDGARGSMTAFKAAPGPAGAKAPQKPK